MMSIMMLTCVKGIMTYYNRGRRSAAQKDDVFRVRSFASVAKHVVLDNSLFVPSARLLEDETVSSVNRYRVQTHFAEAFVLAAHSLRENVHPTVTTDTTCCYVTLQKKENAGLPSAFF